MPRSVRTPLLWMFFGGVATIMECMMLQLCSPPATKIFQLGTPSYGTPHQGHQPDPLHDGSQQGNRLSNPQVSVRQLSICTEATLAGKLRLCLVLAVEKIKTVWRQRSLCFLSFGGLGIPKGKVFQNH